MWTYNYSNELYHHGVKGQKWGVRRYQNSDGSLTSEGIKRQEINEKIRDKADKFFTPSIKIGKDKSPISPAEKIGRESKNVIDNATGITNSVGNISRRNKINKTNKSISEMSNEELQEHITRMSLEERYSALSSNRVHNGASYVNDVLGIVGGTVGLVTAGLGIATTIKKLKE